MHPGLVQVPVFVYPTPITFYIDDQTTHKQVLTLYNPYEFPIRFRVLCTAPNKYTVVDPEGSIRPRCCIDIVVRHNAVSPSNCNVTDKFRVQMQNHSTRQVIGKQDVAATLMQGKPSSNALDSSEEFLRLPANPSSIHHQFGLVRDSRQVVGRYQTPNYVVLLAAIVCIGALLLPTQGDQGTAIPVYLHLSSNLKLIFAYVLDRKEIRMRLPEEGGHRLWKFKELFSYSIVDQNINLRNAILVAFIGLLMIGGFPV